MVNIRAPPNLPSLVRNAFNKAKASGDLTYYPTQVSILNINSVPFQLRFSPALANKPKAQKSPADASKPHDVFENPSPALLVAQLPPSHFLVLNKFAVVPEHFILATSAFKPQAHLLDAGDLAAARACIEAYHAAGSELFVFFNGGEHSGASQAHRHLQLLPVERMRDGLSEADEAWEVLADRLVSEDGMGGEELPFTVALARLRGEMGPDELRSIYLRLYAQASVAAGLDQVDALRQDGEAALSYNLAMTRDAMVLCPRRAEGAPIYGADGHEAGSLALNGTVLAGTALVKSKAEWEALRGDTGQLLSVLGKIGVPKQDVAGEQR